MQLSYLESGISQEHGCSSTHSSCSQLDGTNYVTLWPCVFHAIILDMQLTVITAGNSDRGHNTQNNHRPNHGRSHYSRRWRTIHHPLLWLYRIKSIRRTIYSRRVGYVSG